MSGDDTRERKLRAEALAYHESEPRGKVKVVPTKPHGNARELSLAYSPGVAYPCLEIAERPEDAYRYTAKGNLVAVISNGTAVLGLGNIGALASKPVMEGKGLLLKTFADIDVFDIEVDTEDPETFIRTVVSISKTFGGINLEDIKAPECFEIERRIAEETDIPVMHDDQHGTAIISGAALLNAVELQGKTLDSIDVVVAGAGASAIACARHYVALGVDPTRVTMCDSKGILTRERLDAGELNQYKAEFAQDRAAGDLRDALVGADVLLGLSRGDSSTHPWSLRWHPGPSCSRSRIRTLRSRRRRFGPFARTRSSPRDAPITRTRSTTSWDSPTFSEVLWMFERATSPLA